jgi:hypothetical protein
VIREKYGHSEFKRPIKEMVGDLDLIVQLEKVNELALGMGLKTESSPFLNLYYMDLELSWTCFLIFNMEG